MASERRRETGARGARWIPAIDKLLERKLRIYAYFNNHYAGFAPGSIALFHEVWEILHASH